jgi:hypothetical protein
MPLVHKVMNTENRAGTRRVFGNARLVSSLLLFGMSALPVLCAEAIGDFEGAIRPILAEYCLDCHSTEQKKGDFDLERFGTGNDLRRQPKVLQLLAHQLGNNEMPPDRKPQPTLAQREQVLRWVNGVLQEIASQWAGDPGPVVLRRLSNAEYTHTVRDLTGVPDLDPARAFPADGAAGEGFMNTGNALVMSPSLVEKFFDAAKAVADHAVLLPDGIRFSPKATRPDWTGEILARIRELYGRYTASDGGDRVNLQGIQFETNTGGRLPLVSYLDATLELRDAPPEARSALMSEWVETRGLSRKYLDGLWQLLHGEDASLLLDPIRARWRRAMPGEGSAVAALIEPWQQALWKFNSVGHIGKAGGPRSWMEAQNPLRESQEFRVPVSVGVEGATLYLGASSVGPDHGSDLVLWQEPRLRFPGQPDLPLREVRSVFARFENRRRRVFEDTAGCLRAAAEAAAGTADLAVLAQKYSVNEDSLRAWFGFLGVDAESSVEIDSYFKETVAGVAGYDFVNGWGSASTPSLTANASDRSVRIPGDMRPHSVAVHPSPQLRAVVGWRSPVSSLSRVEVRVRHAHPECGNGVTWTLGLRRGGLRQHLAAGLAQGGKEAVIEPIESLRVQKGDLLSLSVGARDGNHSCDLTEVNLRILKNGADERVWDLAGDVSPDVLAGNPHADRFGNSEVWNFYTETDSAASDGTNVPAGSTLARWYSTEDPSEKSLVAERLRTMLMAGPPSDSADPDAVLYQQLASFGGALLSGVTGEGKGLAGSGGVQAGALGEAVSGEWALDPKVFGKHPDGSPVDPTSLCVRAPSVIEVRLPADLGAGWEFVTTGRLDPRSGREGSVQLSVGLEKPDVQSGPVPGTVSETRANGPWTSDNRRVLFSAPILVNAGSEARARLESDLDRFRSWFPAALCYDRIVPVDEVVTLTLHYREDEPLKRLMLDDAQGAELDRLWSELRYVSRDALTLVDAFEQLWQYATQDADPKVFEPLRQPILDAARAFREELVESEPRHIDAVLEFAGRAYRRPLGSAKQAGLLEFYQGLRAEELNHEQAIRLLIARVLVSPVFLYHGEKASPGTAATPVDEWELASRLSYFLWSSCPDETLREAAASGRLRDPEVLQAQVARMLGSSRVRRLATEFACAWLHVYEFDQLDEKSERHFPGFAGLRDDMYEETIRFFTGLFQDNGSVLEILDADHTFLNERLARHYGIPGVQGEAWRRVDGIGAFSRGGVLGMATTLAKHSGASRTSPILRGNWVYEVLLGERLPRPPAGVPQLPDDEASADGLTIRQLVEKHTSDPSCVRCHQRIDPYGFALEGFDAIGGFRSKDALGRPVETETRSADGYQFSGVVGLRNYLLEQRREQFVGQFCRKLLGYSLGRGVQLSDQPLLKSMQERLKSDGYRFQTVVEMIVRSPQFSQIRGRDARFDD